MKINTITTLGMLCMALAAGSCCRQAPETTGTLPTAAAVVLQDYGAEPTVLNIESYTLGNEDFRTVLWTGNNLQVTLMTIPVGGDVGLEQHMGIDQFLRIEEGMAQVLMGDSQARLRTRRGGRLCDLRPGREVAQHRQQRRQAAETLFDLRPGGAPPRHGTQDPAGSHGGRTRPLTPGIPAKKRMFFGETCVFLILCHKLSLQSRSFVPRT